MAPPREVAAPARSGSAPSSSSSGSGSNGDGGPGIGRELLHRIQSSPTLLVATTSATTLAFCFLFFPLSTKAFFNRLLTGSPAPDDDDGNSHSSSGSRSYSNGSKSNSNGVRRYNKSLPPIKSKSKSKRSTGGRSDDEGFESQQLARSPYPPHAAAHEPSSVKGRVAIFWDVDNCTVPTGMSGRDVALAIRQAVHDLSPPGVSEPIIVFKAYLELSSETAVSAAQVQLRSELQGSGVSLIDTPKSGRKQVADQMMITDLLAFAIDHPAPARIVLISGDRDFAYALGTLRNRGFFVTLVTPPAHVAPILEASAHVVLRWRQDVLGVDYDKDGKPYVGARAVKPGTVILSVPSRTSSKGVSESATNPGPPPTPKKVLLHVPEPPPVTGKAVPVVFKPLVDLLEQLRKQGQPRPLRSGVAAQLKQIDKDLFERAGASRWAEYAAVAEAAGIITLGGTGVSGHEWVSLGPANEDRAPAANTRNSTPVRPSLVSTSSMSPTLAKAKVTQLVAAAPFITSTNSDKMALQGPPAPSTPTKASGTMPPVSAAATYQAATQASSNFKSVDSPELQPFLPLIELLNSQRSIGIPYPKYVYVSKTLDRMISQGVCDAYRQAGVGNFPQYMTAAERAGVARAQGDSVKLHPRYVGVQTTAVTPSVTRMEDTAVVPDKAAAMNGSGKALFVPPSAFGALNKANQLAANIKTKIASGIAGSSSSNKPSEEEVRQVLYQGLIECLREQRAQQHFYSADFFIQLVLAKLPGGETFGRNVDLFNVFLDQAQRDGIVLLEAGFGHGRRHVRLAPEYFEKDAAPGAGRMGGDTLPVAGFELPAKPAKSATSSSEPRSSAADAGSAKGEGSDRGGNSSTDEDNVRSLVPPSLLRGMLPMLGDPDAAASLSASGSKTSQPPSRNGSSSGAATNGHSAAAAAAPAAVSEGGLAPPTAPAAERARFKPLIDALVHLRRQYQIVYPSMEQLHAELRERVAASPALGAAGNGVLGPLGMGTKGEVNPHSVEFVQWLSAAADMGLITIEPYTETSESGGAVSKARLRLAARYEQMFKLS